MSLDPQATPDSNTPEQPAEGNNPTPGTAATTPEAAATSPGEEQTPAESTVTPSPPAEATSAPAPAPAEPSAVVQSQTQTASEEPKRRVQLNPKVDPALVRAVPTLAPTTTAPAVTIPAATASTTDAGAATTSEEQKLAEAASAQAQAEPATKPGAASPPPPPQIPPIEIPKRDDLDENMEAEIGAMMQASEVPVAQAPEEAEPAQTDLSAAAASEETPKKKKEPEPLTEQSLKEGKRLFGTITSIKEDDIFLEFGLPKTGVLSLRQCDPAKPPAVGDVLKVVFQKIDEAEGLIHVNMPRGRTKVSGDWSAVSVGQAVECMVTKTNKGGLEVTVGSLRGFLPASQVELGYVEDLEPYIGQKIAAKVTEVNPARRRLVLSRKALQLEERAHAEKEVFKELTVGETRAGTVKTLKDYGAFVDLGGLDGFLHIGQISWSRIAHPSEVLTVGQQVEVKVISIDDDKKRISLGMRQLTQNPWANAESKFATGSTMTGRVTRTEEFGAFVELEPGVEGLIHISELDHKRVRKVEDVLTVGATPTVKILEVDPKKKRISLSLKALIAAPEQPKADEPVVPTYERKHKGPLKGGTTGGNKGGGLFGDPGSFG